MFIAIMLLYIILATGLSQFYKLTTRTMKNAAAQTVGIQFIASLSCLLFIPFFELRFPSNPLTYLFLILSCVFYAINNFMLASVRKNLEASAMDILKQSYTAAMTLAGFILLGEQITLFKVLGIMAIICGNVLLFWQRKKTKKTKYVWLGLLAYACNVAAGLIDVNSSKEFNLPIYVAFIYIIPALFIFVSNRLHFADVINEYKRANKKNLLITGICFSMQYLVLLIAYSMSEVSVVAPLASLSAVSNVAVGFLWLKERNHPIKKIIAATLAVIGVILIKL